jgi:hypothetical protein
MERLAEKQKELAGQEVKHLGTERSVER